MADTNPAILVPPPAASTNTEADLRPLKPPLALGDSAWIWVAALALALVAALLAWWFLRKKRSRPAPTVLIPPHVRARNRLRQALDLLHDPDRFCTEVSLTTRIYLEDRFELRAPERTTEEFHAELASSDVLTPAQKTSLGTFLERCDLVKFARAELTETELRDLWEAAMRLVEETLPIPEPADPPAAETARPRTDLSEPKAAG